MKIIFVHGWSVTQTATYGGLPRWIGSQSPEFSVEEIYLGKYVSFVDTVAVDDIARAFQQALRDALGEEISKGFACITHSTGGPVVRQWMSLYYQGRLEQCPLTHLVMLAPANHGSALAQLGKGVLGRLKATLLEGIEPGEKVLNWLELGSSSAWHLNDTWLEYNLTPVGRYAFVLTGQRIDHSLYDQLNSYTGEPGSDGVVRVASANLNFGLIRLHQETDGSLKQFGIKRRPRTAFGVLPGRAHSGEQIGIIRSVNMANAARHPTARWVLRCLRVTSAEDYFELCKDLDELTIQTQRDEKVEEVKKIFGARKFITSRYSMLIFRFIDDRGDILTDYDLYLTGGPKYSPDDLPTGFFIDRQRNKLNPGTLTYYVDHDVLRRGLNREKMEGRIGFLVIARPSESQDALAFYRKLEFQSGEGELANILKPNETLMVEVELRRFVDVNVFRVEKKLTPSEVSRKPAGRTVD
jgi:hypothetical protein